MLIIIRILFILYLLIKRIKKVYYLLSYLFEYLISENRNNPVINKLLYNFPNIIYNINDLKLDMIYLINAYNIVGTKSTFLRSLIDLNNNMKALYEYDLDFNDQFDKALNSFSYFKTDFIIYKMKSSMMYKNRMKIWKYTKKQINLMLNHKCPYNFLIIYNKYRWNRFIIEWIIIEKIKR